MDSLRPVSLAAVMWLVLGAAVVADDTPVLPAPTPLPVPTPLRPPTHAEFARHFQPLPGNYEVVLLHPFTHCPVQVCFTLPPGCPKKVRVERRELEFDYGRCEVEIRFYRNGSVRVMYN
jgi:hypothetical protein